MRIRGFLGEERNSPDTLFCRQGASIRSREIVFLGQCNLLRISSSHQAGSLHIQIIGEGRSIVHAHHLDKDTKQGYHRNLFFLLYRLSKIFKKAFKFSGN